MNDRGYNDQRDIQINKERTNERKKGRKKEIEGANREIIIYLKLFVGIYCHSLLKYNFKKKS